MRDIQFNPNMEQPAQNYLSPQGRLSRMEFLVYLAVVGVLSSVLEAGYEWFHSTKEASFSSDLLFLGVGSLLVIYPGFIAMIKRLHDLRQSGWYSLLALIPGVNVVFLLWLVFKSGA